MTLTEIRELWTLRATNHPRVYIGTISYRTRKLWYVIAGDDAGDYAPTGPVFERLTDLRAQLPDITATYYGAPVT